MLVPQYWAEARAEHRHERRVKAVRRFGWSDASQADAQAMADARAKEALAALLAGSHVVAREPKVAYNGADGMPIREEIVARHGAAIITRNAYGARCLNTPNVLFVDVDYTPPTSSALTGVLCVLLAVVGAAFGLLLKSLTAGIIGVIGGLIVGGIAATAVMAAWRKAQGGDEGVARRRVQAFLVAHPSWAFRLYRTPAGLRLLAMHATFKPDDPAVTECFTALGTDPQYARMCVNQQCFRARVSPKPWRIGIEKHLRPQPGIWPIAADRLPLRQQWVDDYERKAQEYAACTFVEELGSRRVCAEAQAVQRVHDELCRATQRLPIA